jgi:chemotaxis protein methyltransferase WspC
MNLGPVVELIKSRIGLDPASLGGNVLPTAVTEGMRAAKLADPVAYAGRLLEHVDEFDDLVERLVVPETWFFRGAGLFDELVRAVAEFPVGRTFRALSVPCSSGEEPYSLAIALLEAGVPPERWSIDAYDLSPRHVAAARRGIYREFSFRETGPALHERYFRPNADDWELAADVRDRVRFGVGNLIDPAFLAGMTSTYDLVLCRNLIIYLTSAARRKVAATIERVLTRGGLLAVGPAEPQVLAGRPFRREGTGPYFLFRHEPGSSSPPSPGFAGERSGVGELLDVNQKPRPLPPTSLPQSRERGVTAAAHRLGAPGADDVRKGSAETHLDRARRFADAGRLEEALAEAAKAAPSADVFSLVGVIQQARGDRASAADAFRKALYLDPWHREALTHSMLIADQQGDAGKAAVLRERLARTRGES